VAVLTRDQLLGQCERRYRDVELPGGGSVRIRSLSEKEKSAYETELMTGKGTFRRSRLDDAKRRLMVLCLVDEDGQPLLQRGDTAALENLDGAVTSHIYDEIREHCGFDAEDIEEAVKNSNAVRVDDSQ